MVKVILLCLLLVACQTTPKGTFCDIADPIRLSPKVIDSMSDAEVTAALSHNRKGEALCGWIP